MFHHPSIHPGIQPSSHIPSNELPSLLTAISMMMMVDRCDEPILQMRNLSLPERCNGFPKVLQLHS